MSWNLSPTKLHNANVGRGWGDEQDDNEHVKRKTNQETRFTGYGRIKRDHMLWKGHCRAEGAIIGTSKGCFKVVKASGRGACSPDEH